MPGCSSLKPFTGTSHPALAHHVSRRLGIPISPASPSTDVPQERSQSQSRKASGRPMSISSEPLARSLVPPTWPSWNS
ncbi:hypothetical protein PGT21_025587 [Puccinia graminis f. sp. tritici]|uniref:Uncharacterized protein n=1 Tax=Puccinia graminis f. sp. tritici TaxID=56615 RepID=A0A5B0LY94_PUCGR|nr:hypothetical protein PGT21_025587 [Puccinia graminis f. sp. tritici]